METIKVNVKDVLQTVTGEQIQALDPEAASALEKLHKATGLGSDFLGWVNLPSETPESLVADIEAAAKELRDNCEYVVAIGIGGSYLGAKAVIEALGDSFSMLREKGDSRRCNVLFAGQNIGEDYLNELQDFLKDKQFGIVVISKSGTTTEPAIAFRLLKEQLEKQAGKAEAARRGLDCETSTPLIFDRYLDKESLRMFADMGVYTKVELEARTEVKWETYTKKIQIEGRVLGDLAMNHIVPIASKYEALLLDKVYKLLQIPELKATADIDLIKKIQDHTTAIQRLTDEMIEARKRANRIEDQRAKAIAYHDTVAGYFDEIRHHIDKLEEIVDDQIWPLPKYRELLFLR